ncbi:MAG: leucine-rich repeat domain-containing protein [Muribaculaceae bacterium]|nr:leucine-rich repeat domain-containing protein [Muribaculaceae bacterium]
MKKHLTFLVALCLSGIASLSARTLEYENMKFSIIDNEKGFVALTGFTEAGESSKELIVPGVFYIEGITYNVTEIAPESFRDNKNLEKIEINGFISCIGERAFQNCENVKILNLTSSCKSPVIEARAFENVGKDIMEFGDLKCEDAILGERAFAASGVSGLDLSGKVISVGKECFAESSLKIIILDNDADYGEGCFRNCKNLRGVSYSWEIYPRRSLEEFPDYFFAGCDVLETLNLGNNFVKSGKCALPPNLRVLCVAENADNNFFVPELDFTLPDGGSINFSELTLSYPRSWDSINVLRWFANVLKDKKRIKFEDDKALCYFSTISRADVVEEDPVVPIRFYSGFAVAEICNLAVPSGKTLWLDPFVVWDGDCYTEYDRFIIETTTGRWEVAPEGKILATVVNSDMTIRFVETSGVEDVFAEGKGADVYNLQGIRVLRNADSLECLHELTPGIYIVGNKKVQVAH